LGGRGFTLWALRRRQHRSVGEFEPPLDAVEPAVDIVEPLLNFGAIHFHAGDLHVEAGDLALERAELGHDLVELAVDARLAAAGETVVITDRGRVVAEIVPPRREPESVIARGIREGWIRPATRTGDWPPPSQPVPGLTFDQLMADLERDREDR
jgi:antitoxin (DNA-binding transcriptional repressor) of toxin-antitoxin stability system